MKQSIVAVIGCGLTLLGCNKHDAAKAGTGDPGSAAAAGSAPTAPAPGSAVAPAPAANTPAGAPPAAPGGTATRQAAALDELDRWLAPAGKLGMTAQMAFLCQASPALREKSTALYMMEPPGGVDPAAWREAGEGLHGSLEGIGLCCKSYGFFDKPPKPHGEEELYRDCVKDYPDAFAAVVKLVPGARPLGTHAGDPLMTPPK